MESFCYMLIKEQKNPIHNTKSISWIGFCCPLFIIIYVSWKFKIQGGYVSI